ncbi:AraC family transcriptional regulator [Bacillus sp. ISL-51]|uniref:GyrI-like domain-containing protein n=1 Tax=Bacteria TaxID=2 RepID=UPI001BED1D32|nr:MULTISPECIES: GyrI-like domain-containing protein [Bacteria]MBT2575278.1 AraC family transcriptional regulator [Bacillus sp. ISL-51]MBT2712914.1 AraC family transcriptional regulator [Pseudomonas sp. ISL-88]
MSFSHFVHLEKKRFIGISERTSNKLEMTAERKIPALWDEFWKRDAPIMLAGGQSDVIALYSDYEQETHGQYTFSIGTFTDGISTFPKYKERILPASSYAVFTSRSGPIEEIVIETWQEVWSWEKRHLRTYSGDFEQYGLEAAQPLQAQIQIFIAVQS